MIQGKRRFSNAKMPHVRVMVGALIVAMSMRVVAADPVVEESEQSVAVLKMASNDQSYTRSEALAAKVEPRADGWKTEVLHTAADGQLKQLSKLIAHPQQVDQEQIGAIIAKGFSCHTLRPTALRKVFDNALVSVHRWDSSSVAIESRSDPAYRDAAGLVEAVKQLVQWFGEATAIRVKFKQYRIDLAESSFTTRIYYEASARTAQRGAQQNATWICQWTYPETGDYEKPRLTWIGIERYEQITVESQGGTLFTDCTESVMGNDSSYRQQVLPGINHWLPRISRLAGMYLLGHHGLAIGDVNGDGLEDMYVPDSGGLPNRLYVQNADGTVTDIASQAGVDWLDYTFSALLIDLDNDGDQDLVLATQTTMLFMANDGTGQFTKRSSMFAVDSPYTLSAADYDSDGDLDLYICGYDLADQHNDLPTPVPYHDANNGSPNALLRNDGAFQFVDVTTECGLDQNNSRFSFSAAWEDYDNDGDMDLYVANDFGRNNLYRNDGGHFVDVADAAGVQDIAAGMAVTWGDYNRDGWMDVYVSNMFSAAGNRVTYQRQFMEQRSGQMVTDTQRMARGNTLFVNAGDGTFRDVSEASAVTVGRWAWSSKFADLNNDGWLDLVVANGYITNEDTDDL